MERCDECGFEYDMAQAQNAASSIVAGVAEFATLLSDRDADLRFRREPATWSPLEYGCHLRDVLLVQRERVLAARRMARPSWHPMGRDERADHDGYADQQPADVGRQLVDAAQLLSNVFNRLRPEDWDRRLMYNYPKRRVERSVRWVAVHTLHEVNHHLLDTRRQLA
jgi:hypothetical protein